MGALFDELVRVSGRVQQHVLDHHAIDMLKIPDRAQLAIARDLLYGQLPVALDRYEPDTRSAVLEARNEYDEPISGLSGSGGAQHRQGHRDDPDAVGMPPPPRTGGPPVTNIRNTSSPHWRGWLKPENRLPGAVQQLRRVRAGAERGDQGKGRGLVRAER